MLPDAFGVGDVDVTVRDSGGLTATATVPVTVNPINDDPVVVPPVPSVVTPEDVNTTVSVATLFDDVDGDTLTLSSSFSHPAIASANIVGTDVDIILIPEANGSGSIDVTADDGNGGSVTATINVDVTPVDDAPYVVPPVPTITTDEDVNASLNLAGLFDDADIPDGDVLTYSVTAVNNPAIASATMTGTTLDIVLVADAFGVGDVDITAEDTTGLTATATIDVTVNPVNDDPVVVPPVPSVVTPEDVSTTVSVATLFDDVDGDTLTLSTTFSHPAIASANIVGTDVDIILVPHANGSGSIDVTADDGNGGSVTATIPVDVTAVNDDPVVVPPIPTITTDEDVNASLNLGGLFDDVDISTNGDSLTLSVSAVSHPAIDTATMTGTTLEIVCCPIRTVSAMST